jgi:hypothetical protein
VCKALILIGFSRLSYSLGMDALIQSVSMTKKNYVISDQIQKEMVIIEDL